MLAFHDALLLPVIRGFAGRKVKSIADALLVTFRSPTDCVLCGMAIQDRLASWNAHRGPAERIDVRIAISLGEVRVDADDVTGDPVQLALRASAFADAGEVVLTESVYLAMNKSEVPTEPFPVRELRVGETRLHRARMTGPRELPYGGRALKRLGKLRDPKLPRRALQRSSRAAGRSSLRWRSPPPSAASGGACRCGARTIPSCAPSRCSSPRPLSPPSPSWTSSPTPRARAARRCKSSAARRSMRSDSWGWRSQTSPPRSTRMLRWPIRTSCARSPTTSSPRHSRCIGDPRWCGSSANAWEARRQSRCAASSERSGAGPGAKRSRRSS